MIVNEATEQIMVIATLRVRATAFSLISTAILVIHVLHPFIRTKVITVTCETTQAPALSITNLVNAHYAGPGTISKVATTRVISSPATGVWSFITGAIWLVRL